MLKSGASKLRPGVWLTAIWIVVVSLFALAACGGGSNSVAESTSAANDPVQEAAAAVADDQVSEAEDAVTGDNVVISTSFGEIRVALDAESAPATVANFLEYVDAGHYEQTLFHRVIPGFMIQGGGFSPDFQRNATRPPILNEANNGVANDRYTIAMARTPLAHSATDQFFINVVDNPFLNHRAETDRDWGYAVFGRVTAGFDVVDQIVSVTTGAAGPFSIDSPVEPVIILSISRD